MKFILIILQIIFLAVASFPTLSYAENIKEPSFAGAFYPDNPKDLSRMVDNFIAAASPEKIDGEIFGLIVPHAGYGFSGSTAAFGYKLIKNKNYKTVIVIGTGHRFGFSGVSVFPEGKFVTPLGPIDIDKEFAQKLLKQNKDIYFEPRAFEEEHSVEVQLPFLQRMLKDFKIVPIVTGDCTLDACKKFASLLKEAIGARKDVLVVVSTDFYHGYDYQEAEAMDNLTISYINNMDAEGLYYGLRDGKLQSCGGFGVVSAIILAKELGHNKVKLLKNTNSAQVTGKKIKGVWTVGYASLAIDNEREDSAMLNKEQREKLLKIARSSIETYLKTGKKLELSETDPVLLKELGVFVTLHKHKELRGCIGNLIGKGPFYLTVRDMAVESATGDPRFPAVTLAEMKDVDIEISALSPMQKIDDPDKIRLGTDGVLVRQGFRSGVFLPQVATETGWTKEEFMSNLCAHKAGLSPDAWKGKDIEIYTFTAEVFSEKEL
ncbi:MAG: AmmeMemoRadiSam system protein B [Candidatus Omnitrophica bacterium]|nr:AmmeMemoRadiSam system protein B [Candidatus Omnitrophota bacterium]